MDHHDTPERPAPSRDRSTDSTATDARSSREARAEDAILRAWPGQLGERVLAAVRELDAFGALAWYLEQAYRDGVDPAALLLAVEQDDLDWALRAADDPAAFLASRVRDHEAAQ